MSTTTELKNNPQNSTQADNVAIRVYNTLTRTKEPFETQVPGKVGIYLCGPTVYKEAHIGHMVGPVIFDTIKRYLVYNGYDVTWVVNITDVDDKLIAESTKRGIAMADVAAEMTDDYIANLKSLGVFEQIDKMPKATDHMSDIINFVKNLVDKGFAYESEGDVYFEVGKDPEYGKLSNRSTDSLQGEGGEMASRKRALGDFALWKKAKKGEPSWTSPWGEGRPGWHIECSAMGRAILGETFDIHGGGLDLVFPHHENEIAQSECCHGKPMARYWMHNGLMRASAADGKVGGRNSRGDAADEASVDTKISRSKGAGGLADLIKDQTGERLRFFLLRTHYRSTIVFGDAPLEEAGTALESFYRFFERYERVTGDSFYEVKTAATRADGGFDAGENVLLKTVAEKRDSFLSAMDDDFNTGAAVSELFDLVRTLNKFVDQAKLEDQKARATGDVESFKQGVRTLKELSALLGIFQSVPEQNSNLDNALVDQLMELLISLRNEARKEKNFAIADRIRDGLSEIGVTMEDRKDGTGWKVG